MDPAGKALRMGKHQKSVAARGAWAALVLWCFGGRVEGIFDWLDGEGGGGAGRVAATRGTVLDTGITVLSHQQGFWSPALQHSSTPALQHSRESVRGRDKQKTKQKSAW
jgi:hypothetical protein